MATLPFEKQTGREPVVIVQIDQDLCENVYGQAPCTASGENKCFNTRKTCQDPENYIKGVLTLSFTNPQLNLLQNENIIPSLISTSTAATTINPSNANRNISPLGSRALATLNFQDHPHSDFRVDPYVDERTYKPFEQSTFWVKWLVRNPYYQNRPIRIFEGYAGQAINNMRVRHYLIDTIQGPDSQGNVSITGKDPLNLADKDKSQVPAASPGELAADITDTQTNIQIVALLTDYEPSGTVRIGDELITYTSRTAAGSIVSLLGVVRGADNTIKEPHNAGVVVQQCVRYTNANSWDVVYDLLINYANIPASFINKDEWDAEGQDFLTGFEISAILSSPQGVSTVLNEIFEQVLAYVWWDEREQKIKFRALRALQNVALINDAANIIENSFSLTTDPRERFSQVWVYYGQRLKTLPVDEESNYEEVRIRANLEVEQPELYGESRIRKVFARWIINEAQAINLSLRLLALSIDNPKKLRISLDAKDRALWTADVLSVQHRNIVDEFGAPTLERYQILSAEEVVSGEVVQYEMQNFPFLSLRPGFYTAADALNYNQVTEEEIEEQLLSFYSNDAGLMPDDSTGWEYQ